MRDSERNQILEACDGVKSAADIMRLLIWIKKQKCREFPDDNPDSPRLWVEMKIDRLAEKIGYSRAQTYKALAMLIKRGFVIAQHNGRGTGLYQVNSEAIAKWLQPMELFEQDSSHFQSHDETKFVSPRDRVCLTMRQEVSHHETEPLYMRPSIPSSSSGVDADEHWQNEESITDVHAVPASPPEEADSERQAILDQCEEAGIHQEHTEALLLARHTRQTIKAALAHRIVRQRRGESVPSGFVIDFCRDPRRWEHGQDEHGCWVPLKILAQRKIQRLAVKARDRPELTDAEIHRRNCALAWESLTNDRQQRIREQISQLHPGSSPARQFMLCQEAALQERKHESS